MKRILILTALPLALAACEEATSTNTMAATAPATTPSSAEAACMRDVTAATGNPNVTVLLSEFSEAGTTVRVGVGPQNAPWQCIAYSDGTTGGIQSLTDEGYL